MAFWSERDLEPKRQFRFRVTFGLLGDPASYLAQAAERPTFTIKGDTAVHFLDKQFMYPGKVTWNQVKIRFVDAVGADGANVVKSSYVYLQNAGWLSPDNQAIPTATNRFSSIGKRRAVDSVKNVTVESLTSNGTPIDKWTLNNAFINTVTLNGFDYAQDGIMTAEYTFIYDWAKIE